MEQNRRPKSSKTTFQNPPKAPKILPGPPRIIHFLLHNKGVAGVAVSPQALSIRPPPGGALSGRIQVGILSLLFSLHGVRAFRRARWEHGGRTPFGPLKSTKIEENRGKSTKINYNRLKSININQNRPQSTKIH